MEKNEFRKNALDMVYLTICAVNGKVPKKERIEQLDMGKLFEVCQSHILTACAAYALESAGVKDYEFTQAKEKSIRKNILFDAERSALFAQLESEGIWYMPLKGALLKDWYPRLGMRQMSDNDILFDMESREDVRRIMADRGFETKAEREVVDEYTKEPVYNFEMHGELFMDFQVGDMADYYRGVKSRLIKDEDNEYGYHFSNEDFYLFMLAHEYKHFMLGGTGVRSLADIYVFVKKFGKTMDWYYIDSELEKLGITDFERESRELAMKLFSMRPLTIDDKKLLDYFIMSGTYGSNENKVRNRLSREGSKSEYIRRRLFPSMEEIKFAYPYFYEHKWLIPALLVMRPVKGFLHGRKRLANELKIVIKK